MSYETSVFLANALIWLGFGIYGAFLAAKSSSLQKRLNQMEMLEDEFGNQDLD